MDLVEKSLKILMIYRLALGLIVLLFATPGVPTLGFPMILSAGILGIGYILRHQTWCLILLGIFAFFSFFGGISGGLNLSNIFSLGDAVLAFILFCGVVICLKERNMKVA